VLEFNLNPYLFDKFKYKAYRFQGKEIPLISEGWEKIEKYYYKELNTTDGILLIHNFTYRIK
jgi:hypothetical protein